ncbi:MAG: esterase family protein [Alistipes sp.]|nr:esterase family protein [Alistipes sp.]
MKKLFTLMLALMMCNASWGFIRETLAVESKAMQKQVPVTVILPNAYHSMEAMPVIYLLHGHGDTHTAWADKGNAGSLADQYNVILVMPDGGTNSWYWDSPVDPTYKYETFVSKELVAYIDSHYKTRADRTGRAITGLSMGGHGGLWLGIRHQDVYGAAGSTSGGVDIRPFPKNWGMSLRLGTIEEYPTRWDEYTVINLVDQLKPDALKLIIDCGTEDFFYEVNCALHEKLAKAKIPHDFYTRPGVHNWAYWSNSIQYQVLFFSNYFKSALAAK